MGSCLRVVGIASLFCLAGGSIIAAQSTPALAVATRSLAALTGGQSITSVVLTGSAHWIAGSDDRSGPARIEVQAGAERPSVRMELDLDGGTRIETAAASPDGEPLGQWSDAAQRISGKLTLDDLWNEPAWIFPALSRLARAGAAGVTATLVGGEVRDGQSVEHLHLTWAPAGQKPGITAAIRELGANDLYLDSATLLPAALDYSLHSEGKPDIAVEIRYSDYRAIAGIEVPFHIQRYLQNGLNLDLVLTDAAINAPIAPTDFAITGGAQ